MSSRTPRTVTAVAAALLILPLGVDAAELGKLNVLSRLGQPLDAEIELSLQPGEAASVTARLGSPQAHAKAGLTFSGALSDVRASVGVSSGRAVVRLRSSRPITDRSLAMLVEVRSRAGRVARPYTVLLDPPGQAAPTTEPKPPVPAEAAGKPAPQTAAKPMSREELFGLPPTAAAPQQPAPSTREELFGLPPKPSSQQQATLAQPEPSGGVQWRGFVQNTTAYTYADPDHWSRAVIRTQLGAQGGGREVKWKATVRLDVDPVYAADDFYPKEVRDDQKANLLLRETYLDMPVAGLEWRIGKQNIVWGEMVGLFFADVVSARDQRDFILPEFEIIRIPQWAVRAEYFGGNFHAEAIWLPYTEVDRIGEPGAEFYPVKAPPPAGFQQRFEDPVEPPHTLRNSNLGVRGSTVQSGWDVSLFYYRSTDVNPTFYRQVLPGPEPTLVFTPRHDRIWQVGGTLGKDLGPTVLKAEVIYASGRSFNVTRLDEPTGVVPQDTFDYVIGLDFTLGRDTRLNLQYYQRHFYEHDPDLIFDKDESGVTLLLSSKLGGSWEPELLVLQSLNRSEGLVRPRLGWIPEKNWRVVFGVDVFTGPQTGFYGRFDGNDRVYVELRRDF